jgi:hypothetical protein
MRGRTASLTRWCFPFLLLAGVSAWIAFENTATGDYPVDGGRAVHLLADGDVSGYLSMHLLMGPFATLVQAPFAALGGNEGLVSYQWACLPCLFATGLVGLYLGALARRRGMPALGSWVLVALFVVNPLTFEAIQTGHPEELLTAALAIGAVALATQGKSGRAALLLGLALASKQWAVVAILPVLMALPRQRLRVALAALGIACAFYLPGIAYAPSSFLETQGYAASGQGVITPWSIWYPLSEATTVESTVDSARYVGEVARAPSPISSLTHPVIVLLFLALPLLLALRRRRFAISGPDAMALLALLALLRCGLDPNDNLYYHLPLLLALIGWDAVDPQRLPLRSMAGVAVAFLFDRWSDNLTDPALFNAAYIALALAAGFGIAWVLFRPVMPRRARRELDVRLTPAS